MEKIDWVPEEVEKLVQFGPNSSREELLALFPNRTWPSIRAKAHRVKIGNRPFALRAVRKLIDLSILPETDRAYIAGFFDGEGTVSMDSRGKNGKIIYIRPYLKIECTDKPVIEWFSKIFDRNLNEWEPSQPNRQNSYSVRVTSLRNVLKILSQLLPYLKIKQRNAQLLIQYCELRLKHLGEHKGWGPPKYSEDEMKLFCEIRALNRKGTVRNTYAQYPTSK